MTRLREKADDPLDIGDEAHVEHPVRFVDHQDARVRQQDLAAAVQVEKASRGSDQHVDTAIELAFLIDEAFAADQQRHRQPMMLAIELESSRDLGRELARRLED